MKETQNPASCATAQPAGGLFLSADLRLSGNTADHSQPSVFREFTRNRWPRWDSNPEPKDYESSALTIELQGRWSDSTGNDRLAAKGRTTKSPGKYRFPRNNLQAAVNEE